MCLPPGGKPEGLTQAEIQELYTKIGRMAIENDFCPKTEAVNPKKKRSMIKRNRHELSISQCCKLIRALDLRASK